jgi:hypothetical protein
MHSSVQLQVNSLSPNFPPPRLSASSMILTDLLPFPGGLPSLESVPNWHSNLIAHGVGRKRQRLSPSLLMTVPWIRILAWPQKSSCGFSDQAWRPSA